MYSSQLFCRMLFIAFALSFVSCNGSGANSPDKENAADKNEIKMIVQPENDGSYFLSAEKGKAIGPKIKYMPEWKAFGWFSHTDKVEWSVDVLSAGAYQVELEWSVSDEEAGKEFALETANGTLTGLVEKSGSWETYKTKEIGLIRLDSGKQKIIFKPNADFDSTGALLDLRYLKLKPAVK